MAALILVGGCTTDIQPGSDPVVVNAEKTTSIAVESLNTFFRIESQNSDLIKEKAPQIHKYADFARNNAPRWISTARALTKTYKNNRTAENKADLETALQVLSEVINQVRQYSTQMEALGAR